MWFVSLWHFDAEGRSTLLTRGWLRGSQRKLDPVASKPWQPVHLHTRARAARTKPESTNSISKSAPTAFCSSPESASESKSKVRTTTSPKNYLELVGTGHVSSAGAFSSDRPSQRRLPVSSPAPDHQGQPHRNVYLRREASPSQTRLSFSNPGGRSSNPGGKPPIQAENLQPCHPELTRVFASG